MKLLLFRALFGKQSKWLAERVEIRTSVDVWLVLGPIKGQKRIARQYTQNLMPIVWLFYPIVG